MSGPRMLMPAILIPNVLTLTAAINVNALTVSLVTHYFVTMWRNVLLILRTIASNILSVSILMALISALVNQDMVLQ